MRWGGSVESCFTTVRANKNVAVVALANKNARVAWALLAHHRDFAPLLLFLVKPEPPNPPVERREVRLASEAQVRLKFYGLELRRKARVGSVLRMLHRDEWPQPILLLSSMSRIHKCAPPCRASRNGSKL